MISSSQQLSKETIITSVRIKPLLQGEEQEKIAFALNEKSIAFTKTTEKYEYGTLFLDAFFNH